MSSSTTIHEHPDRPGGWTHRHDHEAEVYDARADALLATATDDDLRIDPDVPPYPNREHVDFLDHALARLGPLAGRHVLEIGCGQGSLAVWLGLQGASVTAIDVSAGNVRVGRRKAEVNGVADRVRFLAEPIELLDLPDAGVDAAIGNQVLHHVELSIAMPNLYRMLRPGGLAVFCEPVLFLPEWVRRVRNARPVARVLPLRTDTPDERSISLADVEVMRAAFDRTETRHFQLLCRLQNFVELSDATFGRLERLDRAALARIRPAWRLSRYVAVSLHRDGIARTTSDQGAHA